MVKGASVAGAVLATTSAAKSRLVSGFQPVETGEAASFQPFDQKMNQRLAGIFKMHWNLFEVG